MIVPLSFSCMLDSSFYKYEEEIRGFFYLRKTKKRPISFYTGLSITYSPFCASAAISSAVSGPS